MSRLQILSFFVVMVSSCDRLFPPEKRVDAKRVDEVKKCNEFGTCLVIFDDGSNGLMTRPDVGDYGCPSLTKRSFEKCMPDPDRKLKAKEETYEDFPEK